MSAFGAKRTFTSRWSLTLFDYDRRLHVGVHFANDGEGARLGEGDNVVLAVMLQTFVARRAVGVTGPH